MNAIYVNKSERDDVLSELWEKCEETGATIILKPKEAKINIANGADILAEISVVECLDGFDLVREIFN